MVITILFWSLTMTARVQALTLSFEPASQDILRGKTASVDLVISGLQEVPPGAEQHYIGAFSMNILFSKSPWNYADSPLTLDWGLTLYPPKFGDRLGIQDTNVEGGIAPPFETSIKVYEFQYDIYGTFTDGVYLEEVSLLWDLSSLQGGMNSITLATMDLFGENLGTTLLIAQDVVISDAAGLQLDIENRAVAVINVVPEPSTLLLIGLGLIGITGTIRKKKNLTNEK